MKLPDEIAPYATLLKWLLLLVIASALFAGGCSRGKQIQFAKDEEAMKAADDRANHEAAQSAILKAKLAEISDATALAKTAADAQAKQADQAVDRTGKAAAQTERDIVYIDREVAKARRDPTCNELLERQTCALLQ